MTLSICGSTIPCPVQRSFPNELVRGSVRPGRAARPIPVVVPGQGARPDFASSARFKTADVLDLALNILGFAVGPQLGIAYRVADGLLDRPLGLFRGVNQIDGVPGHLAPRRS
jgi:hypothetical protein